MWRCLVITFGAPHHASTTTLHQNKQYIGTLCGEQRIFGQQHTLCAVLQRIEDFISFFGSKILCLFRIILFFQQRIEEGEYRIHGGMVVILHRGIVDHPHISGGSSHSPADAQKEQATEHRPQKGKKQSLEQEIPATAVRITARRSCFSSRQRLSFGRKG